MMLVSSTYHIWSLLDLFVVSIGATCVGMFHVWFLTFQSSFRECILLSINTIRFLGLISVDTTILTHINSFTFIV
jgi:hypothetical protein